MKLTAFDPGGTTGIARGSFIYFDKLPMYFETHMPKGFDEACAQIEEELTGWKTPDLILLEKFTITVQTARKSTAGSKLDIELCGVVKYLAWKYGIAIREQQPAEAMNFVTDEKLKRLGLYTPGPDHARDATRHLILGAVKVNAFDPRLLLS